MNKWRLQLWFMNVVINALFLIAINVCEKDEEFDKLADRVENLVDLLEEEVDKVTGSLN